MLRAIVSSSDFGEGYFWCFMLHDKYKLISQRVN